MTDSHYPDISYAAFRPYPFGGGGNHAFLRSLDRYCGFGKVSLHVDVPHVPEHLRCSDSKVKIGLLHPGRLPAPASLGTVLVGAAELIHDSTAIDVAEVTNLPAVQLLRRARTNGKRTVTTVLETCHSRVFDRLPPFRTLIRRAIEFTDMFRVATRRSRDYLVALGAPPDSIQVLPVGIDSSLFFPPRDRRTDGRFRLLFARRLEPKNGVDLLLDILPKLIRQIPNFELWIAGAGPMRSEVVRRSACLPVRIVGQIQYEELGNLYRDVDVYCNPAQDLFVLGRTFQEDGQYSFPLLEAQRCGLPVVTTDSGANREILAPGNPVVPQRNSTALVDAIVQLASDRRRQELGKANANFIAQRFDAERLQQKFDRAVAELGSG